MKQIFLPTLAEMRTMLSEDMYVKFIWMWRDQEQDARTRERREKLFGSLANDTVKLPLPSPMFVRNACKSEQSHSAADMDELATARLKRAG